MKLKAILVITSVLFFVGCQKSEEQSNQSYTYDLTENGCPTGSHSFSSQEAYCNALKNDSLNNHCANSLRYDTFKSACPGFTW